jgi:D-alanine transaminase
MSRVAYVNGRYVPHSAAAVHIEDRGYQFADGVYEVVAVTDGRLVDAGPHLDRLDRSLRELSMKSPMSRPALMVVIREMVRRNRVRNGIVYIQVSRGVAPRDHAFPPDHVKPALVMTAKSVPAAKVATDPGAGVRVITTPDIRWQRCDIKTVALLPNCLAKQQAKTSDAFEAWQVDAEGHVTEGSSTNAWIVDRDGNIVTRHLGNDILPGITRRTIIDLAKRKGIEILERPFTVDEAQNAREAFITSATSFVTPVIQIDDRTIGNGHPGTIATELRALYRQYIDAECGEPVR